MLSIGGRVRPVCSTTARCSAHRILRLSWSFLRERRSKLLTGTTATRLSVRPASSITRSTVLPSSTAQHHGCARRHDFGLDPAVHRQKDAATTATCLFAFTDRSGRLRRPSSDRSLANTASWARPPPRRLGPLSAGQSPRGHFRENLSIFFEDGTDIGTSRDHPNKNGQILTRTTRVRV